MTVLNKDMRRQWLRLWQDIGAQGNAEAALRQLADQYAQPPRAYHNLAHISVCLKELDGAYPRTKKSPAVALAIWFHDSVYNPTKGNNEQASADFFLQCMKDAALSKKLMTSVVRLIRATDHKSPPRGNEAKLLIDIDLSILAKPWSQFSRYERQIRQEYSWVSNHAYATGRTAILKSFLRRKTIYSTGFFRRKFEAAARRNLQNSIARLARDNNY